MTTGVRSFTIDPSRGGRTAIPVADIRLAATSALAAVFIAIVAAFILVVDIREWLGGRGGLVHWLATATLGGAAGVALWALSRTTEESRFRLLIPAITILLLLQAFRFGADILGFTLPEMAGRRIGSVVDLRAVVGDAAASLGLGPVVGVLALALLAMVGGLAGYHAWKWAVDQPRVTETIVVVYLTAAFTIHTAVPVMGLFGEGIVAWFASNLIALLGAALLLLAAIASGDHRTTATGWRRRAWAWLGEEQPLRGAPPPSRFR